MTTTDSTTAEPIGWHVLAFAAPEPTDWVDHSRFEPLPDASMGQGGAWRGERGAAANRLSRPSPYARIAT